MKHDPTLIIQLQRMGDLILTFPLVAWLKAMEPERPVWIVAEPMFFEALMPFAPDVVFFGPQTAAGLVHQHFKRVINVSHRQDALNLAGSLKAEAVFGAYTRNGVSHIHGDWQLYRASIVHNNRHNRLHWADLAALDIIGSETMRRTNWPRPEAPHTRGTGRIGLFVGASEAAKRPDAPFWAELAVQLTKRGLRPVFLGGKAEMAMGSVAAHKALLTGANLTGHFNLAKFAAFISGLDLMVSPDTGPMHLAAWSGTTCLNLSMGPVNAWETAPALPGHFVLRAQPSCIGCWHCVHTDAKGQARVLCKNRFAPRRVAALIADMVQQKPALREIPGLHLYQTARDSQGLFDLKALGPQTKTQRDLVGQFWKHSLLALLGRPHAGLGNALAELKNGSPHLAPVFIKHLALLNRNLVKLAAGKKPDNRDWWRENAPLIRPLSSYAHMLLHNAEYSPEAFGTAQEHIAFMLEIFEHDVSA